MEEKIIRCPICTAIIGLEKGFQKEQIKPVNGLIIGEIGYSLGGWGNRQNFFNGFSGEVCHKCYEKLSIKINELKDTFKQLEDSVDEGILIYKKGEQDSSDKMSDMSDGKLLT